MHDIKMIASLAVLVGLLWIPKVSSSCNEYKSLMGSPADFKQHVVPSPYDAAVSSRSLLLQLSPSNSHQNQFNGQFDVDSTEDFTLAVIVSLQQDVKQLKVTVKDPSGEAVSPSLTTDEPVSFDGLAYPTLTHLFNNPVQGMWMVTVSITDLGSQMVDTAVPIVLLGFSDSIFLHVSLNTNSLLVGETLTLDAVVTDEDGLKSREAGKMPQSASNVVVKSADWVVTVPDGSVHQEPLHGNINHAGLYQASFTPSAAGIYKSWVQCQGHVEVNGKTVPYMRTAFRMISVAEKSVRLTGRAHALLRSQGSCLYISIIIGLEQQTAAEKKAYRVYSEVWGHGLTGKSDDEVAIGWISGLSDLVVDSKLGHTVSLKLDLSMLLKAGGIPLSLRNVRVEDLTAYVPVTTEEQITLIVDEQAVVDLEKRIKGNQTVESCVEQNGKMKRNSSSDVTAGGRLILVHGYCSSANPFPAEDFTDAAFFGDFSQSRTNDEFARLICEFGEQFDSFGLVAHSHGGIASLHLHTYYQSGLDAAVSVLFLAFHYCSRMLIIIQNGERLIQSLGTPYRGSPLADLLAIIGDLLGIGCGPNPDLTYDSMERWLAIVPADKQQALHYYTTQVGIVFIYFYLVFLHVIFVCSTRLVGS